MKKKNTPGMIRVTSLITVLVSLLVGGVAMADSFNYSEWHRYVWPASPQFAPAVAHAGTYRDQGAQYDHFMGVWENGSGQSTSPPGGNTWIRVKGRCYKDASRTGMYINRTGSWSSGTFAFQNCRTDFPFASKANIQVASEYYNGFLYSD